MNWRGSKTTKAGTCQGVKGTRGTIESEDGINVNDQIQVTKEDNQTMRGS